MYFCCVGRLSIQGGGPVAQWIKRWPTGLAAPGTRRVRGELFLIVNGVPLHTAFHYRPPIALILLKNCWKGRKIPSHIPSISIQGLQVQSLDTSGLSDETETEMPSPYGVCVGGALNPNSLTFGIIYPLETLITVCSESSRLVNIRARCLCDFGVYELNVSLFFYIYQTPLEPWKCVRDWNSSN